MKKLAPLAAGLLMLVIFMHEAHSQEVSPGKYVVQDGTDGGSTKGLWLWRATDPNWGIYMATAGSAKSLSNGTAPAGAGFSSHAMRFRAANTSTQGFIWESSANDLTMSLRASDGLFYVKGDAGFGILDPLDPLHVDGALRTSYSTEDYVRIWTDGDTATIEATGAASGLSIKSGDGSTWIGLQNSTQVNGLFRIGQPNGVSLLFSNNGATSLIRSYNDTHGLILQSNAGQINLVGDTKLQGNSQVTGELDIKNTTAGTSVKLLPLSTSGKIEATGVDGLMLASSAGIVTVEGELLAVNPSDGDVVKIWSDGDRGHIDSYGDTHGLSLRSHAGMKIRLENRTTVADELTVDGSIFAEGIDLTTDITTASLAFDNNNVRVGTGAGTEVSATAHHSVFIGYNAGTNFTNYSFEGGLDPIEEGKSVFVVNNQAQLHNPLLFGTFVENTDHDDPDHPTTANAMAQLAINTHHLVDSCALTVSGAVHIGPKNINPTTFPRDTLYRDFLLWVERGVISENYAFGRVDRWSDFVFDDEYRLAPLAEVEAFIKTNGHLPEIPSEAEVKEYGYDQHGMNRRFLQKIEELTLYIIELEKKVKDYEALEARIKALELSSH